MECLALIFAECYANITEIASKQNFNVQPVKVDVPPSVIVNVGNRGAAAKDDIQNPTRTLDTVARNLTLSDVYMDKQTW